MIMVVIVGDNMIVIYVAAVCAGLGVASAYLMSW